MSKEHIQNPELNDNDNGASDRVLPDIQNNPYIDENGDLLAKYFDDEKIFELLAPQDQKYLLQAGIREYGEDSLTEDMIKTAIKLGILPDPSSSNDAGNSLIATAADVIATIPKGLFLFAAIGAALQAAGAHPITYNTLGNSNADNSDPNNSDTVHHRSPRAAREMYDVKHVDLNNENCFLVGTERTYWNGKITLDYLYTKCIGQLCEFVESRTLENIVAEQGAAKDWSAFAISLEVPVAINNNTAEMKYSYIPRSPFTKPERTEASETFSCNEPPTLFHSYMKQIDDLIGKGLYEEALVKTYLASDEQPDWRIDWYKKYLLAELAKTTTVKPSSSTAINKISTDTDMLEENTTIEPSSSTLITSTLAAKDSTSAETYMAKENTTQMQPNPAPFEEGAVPTSTPQNQSSSSNQGWMNTKLGQGVVASLSTLVFGIGFKLIHYCLMKNCNKDQHTVSCFNKPTKVEQKDQNSYLPLLIITDNVLKSDDSAVSPIGENPTNVDTNLDIA